PAAARVPEHGSGGDRKPALRRPGPIGRERAQGGPADRYDALLPALAEDPYAPGLGVDRLPVEATQLAHAEPGGIQDLEEGAVAEPGERVGARGHQEPVRVVERQVRGQLARALRGGDADRRIGREPARVGEEAEEATHGGELARDRNALGGAVEDAQPVADGGGAHA